MGCSLRGPWRRQGRSGPGHTRILWGPLSGRNVEIPGQVDRREGPAFPRGWRGEPQSRGGEGRFGRARLRAHVCGKAAGEGKKNRENRFPGLGSLAPDAEALGLSEAGTLRGLSGPGPGRGAADAHSFSAGGGQVGRDVGDGLFFPLHRRGN